MTPRKLLELAAGSTVVAHCDQYTAQASALLTSLTDRHACEPIAIHRTPIAGRQLQLRQRRQLPLPPLFVQHETKKKAKKLQTFGGMVH